MSRKEIIYLSGYHILTIMIIIGNLLVAGIIYRWHGYALFLLEKKDQAAFSSATKKERAEKEAVRKLEGVASWNETAYAKKYPWSVTKGSGE